MAQPALMFWCELTADALPGLFADAQVIDDLLALAATVSLAIPDLSAERADVVRRLNASGIPVVAWLLLPEERGYYFNLDNAPEAAVRYAEFQAWTAAHRLRWIGVGMDIEPDLRMARAFAAGRWRDLLGLPRRMLDAGRMRRARATYRALVARMRADGYRTEAYQFHWIVDDRQAGSTVLQRVLRIVDVPVDREVLMLYSSFHSPGRPLLGPAMLWSYAPDAQAIGVGSTGGGVEITPLRWEELARDLRLARRWNRDIAVFSLEGCVQQGFLGRLRTFDWDGPAMPPLDMVRTVDRYRAALRVGLWVAGRPLVALGGAAGLWWGLARARSWRRRS
jgi:hypothetical protein